MNLILLPADISLGNLRKFWINSGNLNKSQGNSGKRRVFENPWDFFWDPWGFSCFSEHPKFRGCEAGI